MSGITILAPQSIHIDIDAKYSGFAQVFHQNPILMKFLTCVNKRYIISNQQYVLCIMYWKYVSALPLNFLQMQASSSSPMNLNSFNSFIMVKIPTPLCLLQLLKFACSFSIL